MQNQITSEEIAMQLIASSGEVRSMAFNAIKVAKTNNYVEAREFIEQAERCSVEAHKAQTRLLVEEANGNHMTVDVLLVHAQDHLMTSILALELSKEIVLLHEIKESKEDE